MKSRYEYYETVKDEYLGEHKGFLNKAALMKILIDDSIDTYYEIPLKYQYRPDLIAYKFYNSVKLQWVLTIANNIENPPEGFYVGRRIRIPNKERLFKNM